MNRSTSNLSFLCDGSSVDSVDEITITYSYGVVTTSESHLNDVVYGVENLLFDELKSDTDCDAADRRSNRALQSSGLVGVIGVPRDKVSELATCTSTVEGSQCNVVVGGITAYGSPDEAAMRALIQSLIPSLAEGVDASATVAFSEAEVGPHGNSLPQKSMFMYIGGGIGALLAVAVIAMFSLKIYRASNESNPTGVKCSSSLPRSSDALNDDEFSSFVFSDDYQHDVAGDEGLSDGSGLLPNFSFKRTLRAAPLDVESSNRASPFHEEVDIVSDSEEVEISAKDLYESLNSSLFSTRKGGQFVGKRSPNPSRLGEEDDLEDVVDL